MADPHDGAAALVTSMGLELLFRLGAGSFAQELVAKLERLLVAWDRFGRPGPRDYDIVFVPRSALRKLRGDGREWMIERTHFSQIDRLSS